VHAKLHFADFTVITLGRVECGWLKWALACVRFIVASSVFLFEVERIALVAFLVRLARVVALL